MNIHPDTAHELFILRTQIEIRLIHLGLDGRLRRHILKVVARISNIHRLTAFAQGLCGYRKQTHGNA